MAAYRPAMYPRLSPRAGLVINSVLFVLSGIVIAVLL